MNCLVSLGREARIFPRIHDGPSTVAVQLGRILFGAIHEAVAELPDSGSGPNRRWKVDPARKGRADADNGDAAELEATPGRLPVVSVECIAPRIGHLQLE